MTCCYQYNEETDWYSGPIRPGFSALEVVFVQTGHDRCVITLIAPHTDHNLYCCSWRTLLEMFPGPRLPIINLLMTPCGVCLPGIPRIHGDTYDNEINTHLYCQSSVETDCLCLRLDPTTYNTVRNTLYFTFENW